MSAGEALVAAAVDDAPAHAAFVDHPSAWLALSPRNARFNLPGGPGFLSYREHGRHLVVFGGVFAPPGAEAALLDAFLDLARERRRGVLVVQARAEQVALLISRGFTVNQFGTSFSLDLAGFSLRGTPKMQLRNKISRARRLGLKVREAGRELPRDAATWADLRAVSAAWLKDKGKPEIEFMVGEIGAPEERARRVFVVQDEAGASLGFITYVPVWGRRPGYLHDLTRRRPEAPPGTMELCNCEALERLRAEGVPWLHFGFTPFITEGTEPPGASRVVAFVLRQLYRHGARVYPARSQAHYKLKWGPELLEREYLAARPLSPRGVLDLLLLTRSL